MGVIAKYKFNNTLEANLLPEFNSEFTSDLYTVTDEVNGEVTTRTIESDSLPTLMRFGNDTEATDRQKSLLEVYEIDLSNLISMSALFGFCTNLSKIERLIYNTTEPKITSMYYAFAHTKITEIDISDIKINLDNSVNLLHSLFYNCSKLHTIVGLEIFDHKAFKGSCVNTFSLCVSLTSLDLSNWNTSNVTNMQNMFYNCSSLTSLDISSFDTSNVTNMAYMFNSCTNLTTLDVSNFNTSNVINMSYMFNSCTNLTSLDVSNFNTSNVTNMSFMFFGCNELTSLDVSNFDTSNVTIMDCMFYYCKKLLALDVSNFDTSKVKNMAYMFCECNNLTSLDVSNFDTSNVTDMCAMFANCAKLTSLRCSNLTTDSLTSIRRIFKGNTNLVTLDISNLTIDTSVVTDYTEIFLESPNIKYIKCNNIDTINLVVSQLPTKSSTSQGTIICKSDITNLDTTTLQSKYWNILDEPTLITKYVFDKSIHNNCIPIFNTEFEGYFIEDEVEEGSNEVIRTIESCGMLPTKIRFSTCAPTSQGLDGREKALLELLYLDTNNLTTEEQMFQCCANLTYVNTESMINLHQTNHMFCDCNSLTSLDVSNFNTDNVTRMDYMFYGCKSLTSLDVSNFNTSKVTTMESMFYSCNNLTTLDVSNFNTNNVDNMRFTFSNCNNLTSLDVSNFNTNKVTNTTNMFANTSLLTDISVLYMDKSSLQKLVDAMPTDSNKTLWYKDVNIDGITHGSNITLKKYI